MKRILTIYGVVFLHLHMPLIMHGQFFDDFNRPHLEFWEGDTSSFEIDNGKLHLRADSLRKVSIRRSVSGIQDSFWMGVIDLDFSPSLSNQLKIFLVKTKEHEISLSLGQTGPDSLIFTEKLKDSIWTYNTGVAYQSDVHLSFKLWKKQGAWVMETANQGPVEWPARFTLPSAFDYEIQAWFTTTRRDKFTFDSLSAGLEPKDTLGPYLIHSEITDSLHLWTYWDETLADFPQFIGVDPLTEDLQRTVHWGLDSSSVYLQFENPLISNKTYTFLIKTEDQWGNPSEREESWTYQKVKLAQPGELIITEFMADPAPSICFPEIEYIELLNRSRDYLNLGDYVLSDDRKQTFLPDTLIPPGGHVCITESSKTNELPFPSVGADQLITINNDEDILKIWDFAGREIFRHHHQRSQYTSDRSEGGYSLEMKDVNRPCLLNQNWGIADYEKCGSPNEINTIEHSLSSDSLKISQIYIDNGQHITLHFNQMVYPSVQTVIRVEPDQLIQSWKLHPRHPALVISLADTLIKGTPYQVVIEDLVTCDNLPLSTIRQTVHRPDEPKSGDILVSEILFNPYSGGVDFFELINNSDKFLNLREVCIDTRSQLDSTWRCPSITSSLAPGQYMAFSKDTTALQDFYQTGHLYQLDWTGLPDDGGRLLIWQKDRSDWLLLDSIWVYPTLHSPALSPVDGISLERLPGLDNDQWLSSPATHGYATPGLPNIYHPSMPVEENNLLIITPAHFSPNADGQNDYLNVEYHLPKNGFTARIDIFDISGNHICRMMDDVLISESGNFIWDGTTEYGGLPAFGAYVMMGTFAHPDGDLLRAKCTFVIN